VPLALYLTSLFLFASPSASAQTLTITHATVVDVSNGQLHPENTVVMVRNRLIGITSYVGILPMLEGARQTLAYGWNA
jgi:hypothetical protein